LTIGEIITAIIRISNNKGKSEPVSKRKKVRIITVWRRTYPLYPKPHIVKAEGYNGYRKAGVKKASTVKTTAIGTSAKKTVDELAKEIIAGKWSAGEERKQKLTAAGYDYGTIQAKVNELMKNQ
jgi:hypothetical protein